MKYMSRKGLKQLGRIVLTKLWGKLRRKMVVRLFSRLLRR